MYKRQVDKGGYDNESAPYKITFSDAGMLLNSSYNNVGPRTTNEFCNSGGTESERNN